MAWKITTNPANRRPDPYLDWAQATGWSGYVAAGRPDSRIPVLLELTQAATPLDQLGIVKSGLVEVPGLYRYPDRPGAASPRFCAGTVARDRLAELSVASKEITRFEIALPVDAGAIDQTPAPQLTSQVGEVVIGVVDRGCAFLNTAMRQAWNGPGREHTRIAALWDQSRRASGPHWHRPVGVGYGRELDAATIDALIAEQRGGRPEEEIYRELDYLVDAGGELVESVHGTHVLDTLAGLVPQHPLEASAKPASEDAAQTCRIVFVSIPTAAPGDTTGAASGAYLLDAVRYILERAGPGARVVINMSLGLHGGPHDGSALIDQALNEILDTETRHNLAITVSAGNGAEERWSTTGSIPPHGREETRVWRLMPSDPTDSFLEIWSSPKGGKPAIRVTPPSGLPASGWVRPGQTALLERAPGQPVCMLVHLERSALGTDPVALLCVAPNTGARAAAIEGRWEIGLKSPDDEGVKFDMWIQRDEPPNGNGEPIQSEFDDFDESRRGEGCEMNNLACGNRIIAIGASRLLDGDASRYSAGTSSGRASERLAANGAKTANGDVDVFGAADESDTARGLHCASVRSGLTRRMSGTSIASPVVARKLVNMMADGGELAARMAESSLSAEKIKGHVTHVARTGTPTVRGRRSFVP